MAACPWCQATVPSGGGPCPRCGRASADDTGVSVPDLDIPAARAKSAAGRTSVPALPKAPPVVAPPVPSHGEIDTEALGGDGDEAVKLDLDFGPTAPPAAVVPVASQPKLATAGVRASQPSVSGGPRALAPARDPLAKPDKAAPGEGDLDPFEVRALADYGDPPEAWWRSPLYAWRVLRRRPELQRLAGVKRRDADRARGAADDALSAFAELVRPEAEKLGAYSDAVEHVRAAEQVLRQRDAVLAAEADSHKQRSAEFDAKLAELEAELTRLQIEERNVAGEAAESDALLKRAEARVKRAEIEIRNALAEAGVTEAEAPKAEP